MNTKISFIAAIFTALVTIETADAFYALQMGRFVNRDPAGQAPRIGMERYTSSERATSGLLERDSIGLMANYNDGMNLYQYVQGNPSGFVDPFGLDREVVVSGVHTFIRTKCNGRCQELHFGPTPGSFGSISPSIPGLDSYYRTECDSPGIVIHTVNSTPQQDQALCDEWDDPTNPSEFCPLGHNCIDETCTKIDDFIGDDPIEILDNNINIPIGIPGFFDPSDIFNLF